jgi:hypothetical protein
LAKDGANVFVRSYDVCRKLVSVTLPFRYQPSVLAHSAQVLLRGLCRRWRVLVRRVRQGSAWHPATDDLRGTDVYGTYGTATSDSTFSIKWTTTASTEFLFATGLCASIVATVALSSLWCILHRRLEFVGHWCPIEVASWSIQRKSTQFSLGRQRHIQ